MKAAILGKKVGMTSFYDDKGIQIPVTVIEAGPCPVTQIKTENKDGYKAVQIGFDEIKPRTENRKATTDNRRDTGTGQQSASRQTPTGQGREE